MNLRVGSDFQSLFTRNNANEMQDEEYPTSSFADPFGSCSANLIPMFYFV